jgi:DNA repair photolyase
MPNPANDALHSQLSKGRRPAQVQIDALERGVGRLAFGGCTVQEIESQTALTDFTMGDMVTGVAWSLNPYVGCLHNCRYCFVPNTIHAERQRWGTYVLVKHNLPNLLRRELEEYPAKGVFISTSTDPYQPVEAEKRVTRNCLRLLARKDWPVDILTRSPLVTRDIDLFERFTRLRVGLSVPTMDDAARRVIEPTAPTIPARLEALRTLADAGLTTYANYAPAYPPTDGTTAETIARAFSEAGVQWVNTTAWRFQSTYLAGLWDETHRTEWAHLTRFVGDVERQKSFRIELDDAFDAIGLKLRTGFFNEPYRMDAAAKRNDPPLTTYSPEHPVALNRACS